MTQALTPPLPGLFQDPLVTDYWSFLILTFAQYEVYGQQGINVRDEVARPYASSLGLDPLSARVATSSSRQVHVWYTVDYPISAQPTSQKPNLSARAVSVDVTPNVVDQGDVDIAVTVTVDITSTDYLGNPITWDYSAHLQLYLDDQNPPWWNQYQVLDDLGWGARSPGTYEFDFTLHLSGVVLPEIYDLGFELKARAPNDDGTADQTNYIDLLFHTAANGSNASWHLFEGSLQVLDPQAPPGPKVQYIELAPRGSGVILNTETQYISPGEQVSMVAQVVDDDGRRNNINWVVSHGTKIQEVWDQLLWEAPDFEISGISVDCQLDGASTFGSTVTFTTTNTPPTGGPTFTLDDLLNLQLWQDILSNQEEVIQAVASDLPVSIGDFRDAVSRLFQDTQDQVVASAGSTTLSLTDFISLFSGALGANITLGHIPTLSAALNPVAKAIEALDFFSAESFWDTFLDKATNPLTLILQTGLTVFFDALESPLAAIFHPIIDPLLGATEVPDEVKDIFGELLNPTQVAQAPLLIALGIGFIGGAMSAMSRPLVRPVEFWMNSRFPNDILPVAQLAQAVTTTWLDLDTYHQEAAKLGIGPGYADILRQLTVSRLDPALINAQVLRWEMAQAAASAGPEARALAGEFDAGVEPIAGAVYLGLLGYESRSQEQILDQRLILPGVQDLVRFAVREAFTPSIVQQFQLDSDFPADILPFTRGQGLPDTFARMFWRAHWELPAINQAFEMFHRASFSPQVPNQSSAGSIGGKPYYTVINESDLDLLLRTQDVMPYWRDRLKEIAFNIVTRVDIRRMYRLGAVDADTVELTYLSDGYSPEDAAALRQFVEREALNEALGGRESEARAQYRQGLIDDARLRQLLQPVSFRSEVIDQTVATAQLDRSGERTLRLVNAWVSAYKKDQIGEATFRTRLRDLGVPQDEIAYRVELVNITRTTDDPTLEEVEARAIGAGTITRRYREGLVDDNEFEGEMSLLGYTQVETGRRLDLANLEFDTNLALDLLAAFRAGLRTDRLSETDFRQALQDLGIRDELIDSYLQYDQLRRALEEPTVSQQEVRATGSGPIITRYQEGWTSEAEFAAEMESVGYTSAETARYATIADLRFDFDFKQDALAVLNSAFNKGKIDSNDYISRLTGLGMDPNRAQTHLARETLRLLDRDEDVTQAAPPPQLPP